MNGMYYDRYIRHCSSRRPPHISPTAPPLKRRCGTRILSNPVVFYLFRYCCFFAFQHSSPSVHPIRSLYLLAALFDFISFIYLFYKRNCNDHFAPYCTCPEYYHNDCLSFRTNTTVFFNILENGLATAHLCIAI